MLVFLCSYVVFCNKNPIAVKKIRRVRIFFAEFLT